MPATTVKAIWTDHTILRSSNGNKEWKVQQDQNGKFRCNCPSYIFCKGIKTCKHIRHVQMLEGNTAVVPQAVTTPTPVMPKLQIDQTTVQAAAIFDAMCAEALKLNPKANIKNHLGIDGINAMVTTLAARLKSFIPPKPVPAAVAAGHITRLIVFDD